MHIHPETAVQAYRALRSVPEWNPALRRRRLTETRKMRSNTKIPGRYNLKKISGFLTDKRYLYVKLSHVLFVRCADPQGPAARRGLQPEVIEIDALNAFALRCLTNSSEM